MFTCRTCGNQTEWNTPLCLECYTKSWKNSLLDDVWYFEFRYLTNNKIQACIFNVKERYKSYLSPKNIRIPFYKEFDRKYVPWKVLRREGLKIINSPEFKRMILARKMK